MEYLSEVSGMTYTEEYGLNIVTSAESVIWDGIVKVFNNCTPFRNVGWKLYTAMIPFRPAKAKGTYVYRPSAINLSQQPSQLSPSLPDSQSQPPELEQPQESQTPPGSPSWDHDVLDRSFEQEHEHGLGREHEHGLEREHEPVRFHILCNMLY